MNKASLVSYSQVLAGPYVLMEAFLINIFFSFSHFSIFYWLQKNLLEKSLHILCHVV